VVKAEKLLILQFHPSLAIYFFRCKKNSSDSIQFEFSYGQRKFLKKLLERKEEIWTLI